MVSELKVCNFYYQIVKIAKVTLHNAWSPFIFKEKCWNKNVSCTEGMSVQADETLKRIKSNKKCSRDDGRTSEYFVVQLK